MNFSDVKVGMRVKLVAKEYPNGDTDGIFDYPTQESYVVEDFEGANRHGFAPNGLVDLYIVDGLGDNIDTVGVDISMIEPFVTPSIEPITTVHSTLAPINESCDHFLNESHTPFKDLTDEHKLLIISEKMKGNIEVYHDSTFMESDTSTVGFRGVYRTKPVVIQRTPLTIPWQHIKPEYKWAAMDEGGSVFMYANKPTIENKYWTSKDKLDSIDALNISTEGIRWDKSLTQRPEGM